MSARRSAIGAGALLLLALAGVGLWMSSRDERVPQARVLAAPASSAQAEPSTDMAARAAAPALASSAAVAADAMFLRNGALDGEVANRVLQGNEFDALLARMRRESDADGIAAAANYATQLRETLEVAGQGDRLQDIACGRHVCVAALESHDRDGYGIGAVSQSLAEQNPGSVNSLVMARASDPTRPNAYRLLFSIESATHSIEVPASP